MTTPPLSLLLAGGIGLLAGTHASIWGMYKDAAYEGFAPKSFARSVILGALCAAAIQRVIGLSSTPGAMVVLFGLAYAAERGVVETWKTFVRVEDQSKYFIPMQFSFRGVPVEHRGVRYAAGVAYVGVIAGSLAAIARLDVAAGTMNPAFTAALVGLLVGTIVAIGGCWKDAPKEGFDLLTFFRSPAVTTGLALLLSRLTPDYLLIACAAIGFERAAVETYKTFLTTSKPPGKFAGKPIRFPRMLELRRYLVPAYAAISTAVVATIAVSL